MSDMFTMTTRDLKTLKKFQKRAPKLFRRVENNLLNDFAFGVMRKSLATIHSRMTIRNKKFAASSMGISKSRPTTLLSQTGSIRRDSFTGWEEQETGTPDKRGRVATLVARRGNMSRQILQAARMKPTSQFPEANDFSGKNYSHRLQTMLSIMRRSKAKGPFVVKRRGKGKLRNLPPGLYRRGRGHAIMKLQTFDPQRKRVKRVKWATIGRDKYFTANPPRQTWAKQIRRVLK